MIAIIDSGSTKADWIITDGKRREYRSSPGMNPNFLTVQQVIGLIESSEIMQVDASSIEEIFFFGTGCSGADQKKIISDALKSIFKRAEIKVDHDIMAAALATCGSEPGIACIIGTGSNSLYFDGKKILPNNYGMGFILSDEGAGTYLGKKIVTHYLYDILPESLSKEFQKEYNLTKEEVIKNVYGNSFANTWLASFSKFYFTHKNDNWIRTTVKDGFEEFIRLFVMNYDNYQNVPVHFVGSIAYHYNDLLREVADEKKIKLGKIIQKPIDELANYILAQ